MATKAFQEVENLVAEEDSDSKGELESNSVRSETLVKAAL